LSSASFADSPPCRRRPPSRWSRKPPGDSGPTPNRPRSPSTDATPTSSAPGTSRRARPPSPDVPPQRPPPLRQTSPAGWRWPKPSTNAPTVQWPGKPGQRWPPEWRPPHPAAGWSVTGLYCWSRCSLGGRSRGDGRASPRSEFEFGPGRLDGEFMPRACVELDVVVFRPLLRVVGERHGQRPVAAPRVDQGVEGFL
jgi:hypothetical protein